MYQKQRQTKRGRAELRLEELSSLWNERPRNSHLPSILEYLGISLRTRSATWTANQKKLMRRARRYYASRFGAVGMVLLLGAIAAGLGWRQNRTSSLIAKLKSATAPEMRQTIQELGTVTPDMETRLADELGAVSGNARAKRNLLLALSRNRDVKVAELADLAQQNAGPDDVSHLVSLLKTERLQKPVTEELAGLLSSASGPDDVDTRLRSASIMPGPRRKLLGPVKWRIN